jgi:Pyruvate/2-oxoacid:ferredoxin oxidoreductase delta subunit
MGFWCGEKTEHGYQASWLERCVSPRVSGNCVNGLGENQSRRASPVYHFAPITWRFPHFLVNVLFLIKSYLPKSYRPSLKRAIKADKALKQPCVLNQNISSYSPAQWTEKIKASALGGGADAVGIVKTDPMWLFEGAESPGQWLILLAFQMDHGRLSKVPEMEGSLEVMDTYGYGAEVTGKLMRWLADEGVAAKGGCLNPAAVNLIPAAMAAGLGELGKHGSMINRELGSAIRLAYVAVDIPLLEDQPEYFLLDDFCTNCQLCTKACPTQAISSDKQLVRGIEKWYVDFDRCLPYFNDTLGCGICLAVCPWSLPGKAPVIARKLQRRKLRKAFREG